jgi:Nuclease-related domain
MIIKKADNRNCDIETLKKLRSLPRISSDQVNRLDKELITLRSGLKGEREAAYHIDFHYGDGLNYAIIHDLRIEHAGQVAQIDHLILGRMLTGFLCETKYWSDGVSINPEGEFTAHYGQKSFGIPSPILQNARHIKVLNSLLASSLVNRPKRLGVTLPINLNPITLVSTRAIIQRPSGEIREKFIEVIKADQLDDFIQARMVKVTSALSIGKLVGADTLRNFAQSIAALHTPIRINYAAKFGIPA